MVTISNSIQKGIVFEGNDIKIVYEGGDSHTISHDVLREAIYNWFEKDHGDKYRVISHQKQNQIPV